MTKYIFVTGGVVSGLGKGITASSIALLLKSRNYKVFMQKFDPYININNGAMSPYQHGEVFVTKDGCETDLDIGHYERFTNEEFDKNSSITSGKIYMNVINKEREGYYKGNTVQVIPHITNEIKEKIYNSGKGYDFVVTEIGGTVGDIESLPFLEAIRQIRQEKGIENTVFFHIALIPTLFGSEEQKTKPVQHSIAELRSLGIQADFLVCRVSRILSEELVNKLALFCNIKKENIINAINVKNIYQIPINFLNQNVDKNILKQTKLKLNKIDLKEWKKLINIVDELKDEIVISIVGKYVQLEDAYLSTKEALKHAGYSLNKKIVINWVDSKRKPDYKTIENSNGIVVVGDLDDFELKTKLELTKYAMDNNIPFLGINFIHNILEQKEESLLKWDTLNLGNNEIELLKNSKVYEIYKTSSIIERYRNKHYLSIKNKKDFENKNFIISGINKKKQTIDIIELKNHDFFIATSFLPQYKSRILQPHNLFVVFVNACIK